MRGHTKGGNETPGSTTRHAGAPVAGVGGWLRLLATLLLVYEPLAFAAAAASAMNAVQVRGAGVVAILGVRLLVTAVSVAAAVALLNRHAAGVMLARVAMAASAAVQVFASLSPMYPSNRMPGDAPLYVGLTLAYYGGWLAYLARSRRVAAFPD